MVLAAIMYEEDHKVLPLGYPSTTIPWDTIWYRVLPTYMGRKSLRHHPNEPDLPVPVQPRRRLLGMALLCAKLPDQRRARGYEDGGIFKCQP